MKHLKKALVLLLAVSMMLSQSVTALAEAEEPAAGEETTVNEGQAEEQGQDGEQTEIAEPTVSCTLTEDCEAENHLEGCPKALTLGEDTEIGEEGENKNGEDAVVFSVERTDVTPAVFSAQNEVKDSGTCGDNAKWELIQTNDNDEAPTYRLVISGSGALPDFGGNGERGWNSYAASITEAVVGEGITYIGSRTFQALSCENVSLPASVTKLDEMAFGGMTKLASISVASGNSNYKVVDGVLFTADGKTLVKYPSLKDGESYDIPNGVETIGKHAFSSTSKLKSITIPDTVKTIGSYAFSNSTGITELTIPDSVTVLEAAAFNGNTSLEAVTIGNGITELPQTVFNECSALTTVNLKANSKLKTIGKMAFYKCGKLTTINLPETIEEIGIQAFQGDEELTSVAQQGVSFENLKTIGASAFTGCAALTEFPISSDAPLTVISNSAFSGTGITEITLPAALETIGANAFSGCNLKELYLVVNGDLTIENSAFKYTDTGAQLTSVTVGSAGGTVTWGTNIGYSTIESAVFIGKISFADNLFPLQPTNDSKLHTLDMTQVTGVTYSGSSGVFWYLSPTDGTGIIYVSSAEMKNTVEDTCNSGTNHRNVIYAVTNGGTFPADTEFAAKTLAEPEKSGYKFAGWWTKDGTGDDWGDKITSGTDLASKATYYAKWEESANHVDSNALSADGKLDFESVTYGAAIESKSFTVVDESGNSVKAENAVSSNSSFTVNISDDNKIVVAPAANLKAGTYAGTITVTTEDGATYDVPVTLTVTKADQSFQYENAELNKTVGDPVFTNELPKDASIYGDITYSSDNADIASVDPSTGAVTIHKAGTVTITATAAGDRNHNSATAAYILVIKEKAQTPGNSGGTSGSSSSGNSSSKSHSSSSAGTSAVTAAKTGDTSQPMLWLGLCTFTVAGAALLLLLNRRRGLKSGNRQQ